VDPVPGRIPGSANLPAAAWFHADGTYLSESEARTLVGHVARTPQQPVVAACGSGVTAAVTIFGYWLLGEEVALFPESYSWWCRQPDRQVATG
jgi:thiosulfate/3-mercaptopyruvate sulfurtransferase